MSLLGWKKFCEVRQWRSWCSTKIGMLKSIDLTLKSGEIKCVNIQTKAFEQCFREVLSVMLYKLVLTFKSVDETLVCDHSNEGY